MAELKALSREAVPGALDKAKHYRLLNEPEEAESICLDILEVDPDNQAALIQLLLSRTDQFEQGAQRALKRASEVLPRLQTEYEREYYAGLICERQAKNLLRRRGRRWGAASYDWFQRALEHYARAITERPAGLDDAILRWNTCVRMIERHVHCGPASEEHRELGLE